MTATMSVHYTLTDLKSTFPPAFFERARSIHEQQRIRHIRYEDDPHVWLSEVVGSRPLPYRQRIQLNLRNGKLIIDGSCDCPIGRNCKHVIAVLMHALQYPPQACNRQQQHTETSAVTGSPAGSNSDSDLAARNWLHQVQQIAQRLREPVVESEEVNRLLYVLSPNPHDGLDVRLMRARVKKDLTLGKAMRYTQFFEIALGRGGSLASSIDRTLCARILQCHPHAPEWPGISGSGSGELLRDLIASGRAYWTDPDTTPLSLADPVDCELDWIADDRDNQQLGIALQPHERLLLVEPPWRLDTHSGQCSELHTGLPDALASALLRSPSIPNDLLPGIAGNLQHQLPEFSLPTPQSLQVNHLEDTRPLARLVLRELPVHFGAHWKRRDENETHRIPVAQVEFSYHGLTTLHGQPGEQVSQRNGLTRSVTRRDLPEEQRLLRQLLDGTDLLPVHQLYPALAATGDVHAAFGLAHTSDWLTLMIDDIPALRQLGWQVRIEDGFPYQIADAQGDFSIEIDQPSGSDWFDLDLGIEVDGERISLLPILSQTFQQYSPEQIRELTRPDTEPNRKLVCMLPDGRMLGLPLARLQGILSVLVELFDSSTRFNAEGKLELHALHASRLAELEAIAQPRWLGGERLIELGRKLHSFSGIASVPPPPGLAATLRGYQQQGLDWLQFLREYGLAGILADDMGLGKTLQTLAHLLVEKRSGRADLPSLVVAPTSLMFNWRAEAARFAPDLRVLVLHGNDRKQHFDQIREYDLILTTYPLLPRDREFLTAQRFHLLILDEAHAIKNPKALSTQIVHQIHARHRLALTGTPMENHLGELWSLFHFLLPGLLGSAETFKRQFRTPIEKHDDPARHRALIQRIRPFLLRRTKAQVATELPPKTEIVRSCELGGDQRDLYESVRSVMHDKIRREIDAKGFRKSQIVILDALLKLRQVCCDPRLLKLPAARRVQHSAKLDMLTELLPEMIEEGRRILLFSQFTSMLDLIEPELHLLKIPYVRLTGETQDRAQPVTRFQNGEVPLFLVSLKAGGVGLNLTAADTVIHYDPWWNPAVEDQATGRAHRIGQANPVFAWKLTTVGTVEEKIVAMQERKRSLAQGVLGDADTGVSAFTPDELINLFEPG